MSSYFEYKDIKIYNDDCNNYLKKYKDNYFDVAIIDPPYGINIAKRTGSIGQKRGQGKLTKYTSKNWDVEIPNESYWKELFRVSKNQVIFGANYFTQHLPPAKGWIVWDKKQPEGVSFAMGELAFTSIDKSVKIYSCSRALIGNKVANNKQLAQKYIKIHPTQKPVDLYKWILHNYTSEGDLILDTHLGSGSIAIACHQMKRKLIAYEIDAEYYEKACKRFKEQTAQQALW